MQPLVSIIIPTYNRAHLIGETLESVLAQTYPNWECIVVDDGSIDVTDEMMEFYCAKDERIKYFYRPKRCPKGANACRNYGFEMSKGSHIQYLDSDDLLGGSKIKEQIKILNKKNAGVVAICPWAAFTSNKSNYDLKKSPEVFKPQQSPKQLFDILGELSIFLPPHCYLIKRELVIKVGGWNEHLSINQDGEYFSRILLQTEMVLSSNKSIVYYRRDTSQRTSAYNSLIKAKDMVSSWKLIEQHHKIHYKIDCIPYVEGIKEMVYLNLLSSGYSALASKEVEFFKREKLKLRRKRIRSWMSNPVKNLKKFMEVRIVNRKTAI